MDEAWQRGIDANRARWDEAGPLHAADEFYDFAGFRAGRDDLHDFEPAWLGDVTGLDLVHLQCHVGADMLSCACHGAREVGLDFTLTDDEVEAIDVLDTDVRGGPEPEDMTMEAWGRPIREA